MTTVDATERTHSAPPEVTVEGRGRLGDIPVITLNLEGGAIARSMMRSLARSLSLARAAHWLHIIGREPAGSAGAEQYLDRALDVARPAGAFQVELDLDAAHALYQQLNEVLDVAETECRWDPCVAVGTLDGLCPAHHDRLEGIGA